MTIDHVTVEKDWQVEFGGIRYLVARGQVLIGKIETGRFIYPMTMGLGTIVFFTEYFADKRILPVFENLTLS